MVITGDSIKVLRGLAGRSVNCCVTSPPYWGLRDYGHDEQIGQEASPDAFVARLVEVFSEVRRVLRDDGTCWVNLGDSYANDGKWGGSSGGKHAKALHGSSGVGRLKNTTGLPPKSLIGIPWRVAFALQADGWFLRQDIIWHKPNPMPESVTDRCTKAHEYLFLLSKSERYHYDSAAIAEAAARGAAGSRFDAGKTATHQAGRAQNGYRSESDTRNRRSVWTIPTQPFAGAHFAVMPEALVEPCVLAGCPAGGLVLDPFTGSGTVGAVARRLGREFVGAELNPEYAEMARRRIAETQPPLFAA